MSLPSEKTDPTPANRPAHHRFLVQAEAEPSVLARVVELFVLRDLLPQTVSCRQDGPARLRLDVTVDGLEEGVADHLAARMRNIMPVVTVIVERQ
ncbi:MAG: hypothetical protein QF578_24370 [Alphaproteobacteria bacterium]|jgi:acetolactate synthase small subunit|nr:hypothetical protein [Alphaproteobacteria bacterium]MDP6815448.1 hypothetical protein [Alphaproteobacteria bacterium]